MQKVRILTEVKFFFFNYYDVTRYLKFYFGLCELSQFLKFVFSPQVYRRNRNHVL